MLSLPPWRKGESGTELSRTARDQGGGYERTADDFGAVYGDDGNGDDGQRRTPEGDRSQRGGRSSSGSNNQRGNDESKRGGGARAVAHTTTHAETLDASDSRPAAAEEVPLSSPFTENIKPPSSSGISSPWPGTERAVDGGTADACLTDGSSDDGDGGSSYYSRQMQNRDGLSLNNSSRPRNEDRPTHEDTCAANTDAAGSSGGPRRHSSWSAGTRDGCVKSGGRDRDCGFSEREKTSRSRAGESQRSDGRPPPVDPENEVVVGVHDLERSGRGVS